MNELLHNVNEFIDKEGVITNFYLFIGYIIRCGINNDGTIAKCFLRNPIEFTRLYEELTDVSFDKTDEEITHFIEESSFKEEYIDRLVEEEKALNELREKFRKLDCKFLNNCGPLFLLLLAGLNKDQS